LASYPWLEFVPLDGKRLEVVLSFSDHAKGGNDTNAFKTR
jgi:hypothetical protein